MQLGKAGEMLATLGTTPACQQLARPPCHRRHASHRPSTCAADQNSGHEAPARRRDILLQSTAAAAALGIQALAARLARAEDGAMLLSQCAAETHSY